MAKTMLAARWAQPASKFLMVNALVNGSFQGLAGFKLRYVGGSNLNPLPRPRVAACGGFTMRDAESAKADETDFRSVSKGGSNSIYYAINGLCGI